MKKSNTTLKKFRLKNKNKLSSQARKNVLVRTEHLQKEKQIKDLEEVIKDSEEATIVVQNPKEAEALRLLELRNYLQNFTRQKYFLSNQKNKTIRGQYVVKWQQVYDLEEAVNHFNATNYIFETGKREVVSKLELGNYQQKFRNQKYFLSNQKNKTIRGQYVVKWQQIYDLEEAVNHFNATNYIFETGKREVVPVLDLSEFLQIIEDKESSNQISESLYHQQSQLREKIKNTEVVFLDKPKFELKENVKRRDLLNFNDKIRKKFHPKVNAPFSFDLVNKNLDNRFQYSFEKSENYQKIQNQFVNAVLKKERSDEMIASTNRKNREVLINTNLKIQKKFQTAFQSLKKIKEEKKSTIPQKKSKRQLQNDVRKRIVIEKQKKAKFLHSFKKRTKEKKPKFEFIKEIKRDSLEQQESLQSKIASINTKMNRPKKKTISFSALRQSTMRALLASSDSRFQISKRNQEIQKRIAKLSAPKKQKFRARKIS